VYTPQSFYKEAGALVNTFNAFVEKFSLLETALPDHICFKCDSNKVYEDTRAMLESESEFIHQSYISGRRIAILKLKKAFKTSLGPITVLELSDQKINNSQKNGFDHIEIYSAEGTHNEFVKMVEEKGVPLNKIARPHHTTYDIKLEGGFNIKLTEEPVLEKIKRDEM
jgi:predicted metalloenzyme YecM